MKFVEYLLEIYGWCRIVISPLLVGIILGWVVYLSIPSILGIIFGILTILSGLTVGIIWANKIWRSKNGTFHFISRVSATPELDEKPKEEK